MTRYGCCGGNNYGGWGSGYGAGTWSRGTGGCCGGYGSGYDGYGGYGSGYGLGYGGYVHSHGYGGYPHSHGYGGYGAGCGWRNFGTPNGRLSRDLGYNFGRRVGAAQAYASRYYTNDNNWTYT